MKSGVPAEAVLDILVDMMDFPGKEQAKARVTEWMQMEYQNKKQQQQLQQMQAMQSVAQGVAPQRIAQPPNQATAPPM
jgi:hypothetical protein